MQAVLKTRALWSYTLAHFSVDLCSGALPVIVLYLARTLNFSIAQSGFAIGAYAISSSLSQPLFGYLSDRTGGRYQSAIGLATIAIFQGALGFATSYAMLLAMACLAGCGSAAFHPHGASGANRAGGERKAAAMAVFMLGGNSGYALGPVIAATAMTALGVHGSVVLVPLAWRWCRSCSRRKAHVRPTRLRLALSLLQPMCAGSAPSPSSRSWRSCFCGRGRNHRSRPTSPSSSRRPRTSASRTPATSAAQPAPRATPARPMRWTDSPNPP